MVGENIISFDEIINENDMGGMENGDFFSTRLGPIINGKAENFLEHAIGILNRVAG